jgi:hypothetical protein
MTLARDRPAGGQHRAPPETVSARLIDVIADRVAKATELRLSRWTALVFAVVFVILLGNATGRIFFDTKLGVDIAPVDFYARLWQLWNPNEWFGTLSDQYIGYAVPMDPFYLLAEILRVPVWLTERLWLSLLVAVGFAGVVKLGQELQIGTERIRPVANFHHRDRLNLGRAPSRLARALGGGAPGPRRARRPACLRRS